VYVPTLYFLFHFFIFISTRRIQSENKLYLAKFKGCSYDEENLYLFELDTDSAVNTQWLKFIKRYNKRRALIRSGKLTGGPVVKQWWIKVLFLLCSTVPAHVDSSNY
jgi:hypothetical protein